MYTVAKWCITLSKMFFASLDKLVINESNLAIYSIAM